MIQDVTTENFDEQVVGRSHEVPVVVDFWAEWCGPCRQLGPALEKAAKAREGQVDLAKVDVDSNQPLAAGFGVQGIPAVKAFRGGKVVDEFVGAVPPAQVEAFFDGLAPSEAESLAESDDEESLREALELDSRNVMAARKLGRILLARGETDEASTLLHTFESDFEAAGIAARGRLMATGQAEEGSPLARAFQAWDEGYHAAALDALQDAFATAEPRAADEIRQVMVAIFTELGPGNPVAAEHRRRLATALH